MSRTFSDTFKSAMFGQQTDEVVLVLLTLDHDDLASPIRVTSDGVDSISNGETFLAYPFQINLPEQGEDGPSVGKLTIDNVNQSIAQAVRSISTPPDLTIQIVLASDPDTVEVELTNYEFTDIVITAETVVGNISRKVFYNEPYPCYYFIPSQFPGMF